MPMETRREPTPSPTLTDEPDESTTSLTDMDSEPPLRPTNQEPLPAPQQPLLSPVPTPDPSPQLSTT
ncbi:unnamed protein product [Larinioides sclopetarius]|uniref:Uncharacterized protein n=1 Tax=Larinioides sclopetarius TaxID=280406 RepID=A0AAV2BAE1_9ARAC